MSAERDAVVDISIVVLNAQTGEFLHFMKSCRGALCIETDADGLVGLSKETEAHAQEENNRQ